MNTHSAPSLRWLFPLLLLAPPAVTAALVEGVGAPAPLAMTATVLAVLALVVALERRWPHRASWGERSPEETRTDLVYVALASLPDRGARVAAEALGLAALGALGVGATSAGWAEGALRGLAALLVADVVKYGLHRASHERPWLWRFHLAHHQPRRVDALNALRLHPVNVAYYAAADALAMTLLRVPPTVAAVIATLRAVVGVLQHANLELDAQRQWLFNTPGYHRTHHAVDLAEAHANYGSTLLVWDRLFGTLSRRASPRDVGVASSGRPLPEDYVGQTLHPFCGDALDTTCAWARLRAALR